MIDVEDIFKAIISYLSETLPLDGGGTITRINYYINQKNVEKGDSLLDFITDDSSRYVLNQRMKDMKAFKSWIDIAVAEEVELQSNYDTAAKTYAISVNSVLYDDLSNNTFYKSVRMAEVLKNIMMNFLKEKMSKGFMFGACDSNILPTRVDVKGTKALSAGVTYLVIIQ